MNKWSHETQLKEAEYNRIDDLRSANSRFMGGLNNLLDELQENANKLSTQSSEAATVYQEAIEADIDSSRKLRQ